MLEMQGHTISGISLSPHQKSLYNQANLSSIFQNDLRVDIRNRRELAIAVKKIDPEVIVHLAAQPIVTYSYSNPVETFETNVLGTLNILEATKPLKSLLATLVITTDKVYKNHNYVRGYVEADELGGDDPYSASKAAADITTQSWFKSFGTSPVAIARAGNVIGGGDWGQNRIIPDLVDAYSSGSTPALRYPDAIRPWQHVFDCLSGYLQLIQFQLSNKSSGIWNFGPSLDEKHSVVELVSVFAQVWGISFDAWKLDSSIQPHEANTLLLNSEKARRELKWSDKLDFYQSVQLTVDWYKKFEQGDIKEISQNQLKKYLEL